MTIRAEQIVNATLELTLRPQSEDRKKVVACVIREVADRLCTPPRHNDRSRRTAQLT